MEHQRTFWAVSLFAFATVGLAGDVVRDRRTGEVLFTPAHLATDSEGRFNERALPRDFVQRNAQANAVFGSTPSRAVAQSESGQPCSSYVGEPDVWDDTPKATAQEAIQNAVGIYIGIVADIEQGFVAPGNPGSLLSIAKVKEVKASPAVAADKLRVFYPDAQFIMSGMAYCARSFGNSHRPRVGDKIVVFVFGEPPDAERSVVFGGSANLVFEDANGLALPDKLTFVRDWRVTSVEEIERHLVRDAPRGLPK